ncbi:hypothetical protein EV193_104161 [Herbihabitans rhizosphaerae]|uniref:Uncharacterized protein n=1 Tax=Herbihabitans rhizosphaerae TaxID=1872711 RepID=A0A4Q7KS73_9PSEU|nr:hypothetical protein [Herbihabitans rhizosphaerae]RZS38950.1 hypothetical protein EV193_104161 [Herbihabitans rhizosphaerae]
MEWVSSADLDKHDELREQVRRAIGEQWGERPNVAYFRRRKTVVRKARPVHGSSKTIVGEIYQAVRNYGAQLLGIWFRDVGRVARTLVVHGDLPDLVRAIGDRKELWVVWSASHTGFAFADGHLPPQLIWEGRRDRRPAVNATRLAIDWPDGNMVVAHLSRRERAWANRHDGRP